MSTSLLIARIFLTFFFLFPLQSRATFPEHSLFFNHVHSKESRDASKNEKSKTPEWIYKNISEFLEARNSKGFLAITDHNNHRSYEKLMAPDFPRTDRLTSIRAVEWGAYTHVGLLGVKPNWPPLKWDKKPNWLEQLEVARDSGGLVVVNHPSIISTPWPNHFWGDADAVEVFNQPYGFRPMHFMTTGTLNPLARTYWVNSLNAGKRYTALAGSDFHYEIDCFLDQMMHYPLNLVLSKSNDPIEVLNAVRGGKVSILTSPHAPKVALTAQWANEPETLTMMGQEIVGNGNLKVTIDVDFAITKAPVRPQCYSDWLKFFEAVEFARADQFVLKLYRYRSGFGLMPVRIKAIQKNETQHTFDLELKSASRDYIRVELVRTNPINTRTEILALTNPIYIN